MAGKNQQITEKNESKEAVANGRDLAVSIKHAVAICNMIRGKEIDNAIKMLEEVVKMKKAVPMGGEIPHRRGMMSGRYPVKASKIYIQLLKSLKANALAKEIELEKTRIFAMPNVASRPYRRFGTGRFKRSHVLLKLVPLTKKKNKKEKK
jgi:ribosomal protein uL22